MDGVYRRFGDAPVSNWTLGSVMRPVFRQTRVSGGSAVAKTHLWVRHLGTGKGVLQRPAARAPVATKGHPHRKPSRETVHFQPFFSSPHDPPDILVAALRHDAARDAGQILFDVNHVESVPAKQFGDGRGLAGADFEEGGTAHAHQTP